MEDEDKKGSYTVTEIKELDALRGKGSNRLYADEVDDETLRDEPSPPSKKEKREKPPAQIAAMEDPPLLEVDTMVVEKKGKKPTQKMIEPADNRQLQMVEEPQDGNREPAPSHGQTAVKYGLILKEQGHARRKYFGTVKRR